MSKVIGVDGTTNSYVAIMEGSNAQVIENSEGYENNTFHGCIY